MGALLRIEGRHCAWGPPRNRAVEQPFAIYVTASARRNEARKDGNRPLPMV
jgi:hypothetical protein